MRKLLLKLFGRWLRITVVDPQEIARIKHEDRSSEPWVLLIDASRYDKGDWEAS